MHDDLLSAGLVLEAEEVRIRPFTLGGPGQKTTLGLVRRQRPWRGVAAVVQAAHDKRAVRVAVEEHHHHFVADAADLDAAEAAAGAGLGDAAPAGALVVELLQNSAEQDEDCPAAYSRTTSVPIALAGSYARRTNL